MWVCQCGVEHEVSATAELEEGKKEEEEDGVEVHLSHIDGLLSGDLIGGYYDGCRAIGYVHAWLMVLQQ